MQPSNTHKHQPNSSVQVHNKSGPPDTAIQNKNDDSLVTMEWKVTRGKKDNYRGVTKNGDKEQN